MRRIFRGRSKERPRELSAFIEIISKERIFKQYPREFADLVPVANGEDSTTIRGDHVDVKVFDQFESTLIPTFPDHYGPSVILLFSGMSFYLPWNIRSDSPGRNWATDGLPYIYASNPSHIERGRVRRSGPYGGNTTLFLLSCGRDSERDCVSIPIKRVHF